MQYALNEYLGATNSLDNGDAGNISSGGTGALGGTGGGGGGGSDGTMPPTQADPHPGHGDPGANGAHGATGLSGATGAPGNAGAADPAGDLCAGPCVEAPALTAATPTITGTARVGSTLTAHPGTWGPAPVTVAYQWSAAGTPISGATHPTYVPQAAQRGATLTVTVKGTKTGYAPASRSSTPTPKVATGVLTTATPKISGIAKVGSAAIKGQTGKSLKLTLVGKRIMVKVTGSKAGYATASRSSAATAPVRR